MKLQKKVPMRLTSPQNSSIPLPSLLGLITFLSYVFFNAHLPLTDPVETNYALTAKEMVLHNDWLSPTIYGNYWYDKPIFTYWMIMVSFKLFGISDFAARLPGTLASTASVIAMYYSAQSLFKSKTLGIYAAGILAFTLEFFYIGHAVVTDGFLLLFSIGIFALSYKGLTKENERAIIGAYCCAALGVLTKGPVAIVLPGLIALIYIGMRWLLYRKSPLVPLKQLTSWKGILVFLIIASPWYIAMYMTHGMNFINGFLGLQNVGRALISEHPKYNVWYFYLGITPILLLPWTPLIIYQTIKNKWTDSTNQFGIIWFLVVFLFYSLVATKYITYTFIGIIPLILWAARGMENIVVVGSYKLKLWLLWIPIDFLFLAAIIGSYYDDAIPSHRIIGAFIISHGIWFLMKVTKNKSIQILCTKLDNIYNSRIDATIVKGFITVLVLFIGISISVSSVLYKSSGLPVAQYVSESNRPIYTYGIYYTSLVYYTDKTPTFVTVPTHDDVRWTKGKNIMPNISEDELAKNLGTGHTPIMIVVPHKFYDEFEISPLAKFVTGSEAIEFGYIMYVN